MREYDWLPDAKYQGRLPDPEDDVAIWKAKYKHASYMRDFEEALRDYMVLEYPFFDISRLAFTTWGKHRARNTWADFQAVVAAGTLFKPDAVYEAQYRIAKRYLPQDGLVNTTTLKDFRLGEYCDDLIQGLGRIRIRGIDRDNPKSAPPAKALVVAAQASIPLDCYGRWFPGSTVRQWKDVKKVRGESADTLKDFEAWTKGKPYGSFLSDDEAQALMGIDKRKTYHNRTRNKSFQTKLTTLNIVKVPGGWQYTMTPFASEREIAKERRA